MGSSSAKMHNIHGHASYPTDSLNKHQHDENNENKATLFNLLKLSKYKHSIDNKPKWLSAKERFRWISFGYIRLTIESQYELSGHIPIEIKLLCCKFLGSDFYEYVVLRTFAPDSNVIISDKFGIHTHSSPSNVENSSHKFRNNKIFISQIGGWQSGKHQWKIKILQKNNDETSIGICCVHRYKTMKKHELFDWENQLKIDRNKGICHSNICCQLYPLYIWYCYNKYNLLESNIYQCCSNGNAHSMHMVQSKGFAELKSKKTNNNRSGKVGYHNNDIVTICLDCDNWKIYWMLNDEKLDNPEIDVVPNHFYYPVISSNNKKDTYQILLF